MIDCKEVAPFYRADPRQHFLAGLLQAHLTHRVPCQFCGRIIDVRDRKVWQHDENCDLTRAVRARERL